MRRIWIAALAAAGSLGLATAADAALTITLGTPASDGSITGTYSSRDLVAGAFDETITFNLPTGLASSTLTSTFQGGLTNVDFTSATLNGAAFTPLSTGQNEFRVINDRAVTNGLQTLRITGTSAGEGSYSGTIAFSPSAQGGVPEPATWALMIGGFGAAGVMIRRRKPVAA